MKTETEKKIIAGWPCEMEALKSLCSRQGLYLVEDCAQAHGAKIGGKPAGSFGDFAGKSLDDFVK